MAFMRSACLIGHQYCSVRAVTSFTSASHQWIYLAGAGGTTGGVAGGTAGGVTGAGGGVTGAGGALGADDTEGAGVMAGALLASLAGCSAAPGAMVFLQLVRAASVMIASMMVVFMGWISECRHIPPLFEMSACPQGCCWTLDSLGV